VEQISSSPYTELPTEQPSGFDRRSLFLPGHNRVSIEHASDEMPAGRVKLLHRYGAVARVELKILNPCGYTGLLASGGTGILRYSDASGGEVSTHSFALKLLVDGQPSRNLHSLPVSPSTEKVADPSNPLLLAYSTMPADAANLGERAIEVAFSATAKTMGAAVLTAVTLPLDHLANVTATGEAVESPQGPERIDLHPTAAARAAYQSRPDPRESLGLLEEGLPLLSLLAADTAEGEAKPWAELHLSSRFIASAYGDERLFFQHNLGPIKHTPLSKVVAKLPRRD